MERDQETITPWGNEEHRSVIGTAIVAQPSATHSADIAGRKRLEDELRESEWRFRTMFEHAPVGITYTALDGQLLEVNQRFCDIVGYTREELLKRTFRDITHPDDLEANEAYLQRLIAGNPPTPSLEKRYIHKNGRVVWVHLTVSLMRDPLDKPQSYMAVIEDITARKQVEEERAQLLVREQAAHAQAMERASQLEAVIEAMADGVFIYDAEARLLQANKTAREIFALDLQPDYSSRTVRERVSQTEIRNEQGELIPEEEWPMLRIIRGEVFKGTNPLDVMIRALDGRDVRLSISGAPVIDSEGHIIGGVLIVRDATERRLNELALSEANRRMDEFLGVASHELRTPLTSIKANIQMTERQLKKVEADGAKLAERLSILRPSPSHDVAELVRHVQVVQELLSRADQQSRVLNRLIGDLLNVSRIQTNTLAIHIRPQPSNLLTIVQQAVQEQSKVTPKRSILLQSAPQESILVRVDPDRIAQVVMNFLSNALKYSSADQPVEVSVEVVGADLSSPSPIDRPVAQVSVHDKGPGLTAAQQAHIWERFYRVPDIEVKSGSGVGLGLGLYISKTIIERHHGQVGVHSTPGKGATFWFTVPLAE